MAEHRLSRMLTAKQAACQPQHVGQLWEMSKQQTKNMARRAAHLQPEFIALCKSVMEQVFPPYHVFINHRGPDVKKTLASLIYHALQRHGLRVFLDKHELKAGDSLTPAIKSAISSASVQIVIFSKTYAQSAWCLNELLWMFDSKSSKIIPIFYDIQPSDLRHVDKGAYACAFEEHRDKGRVTIQLLDSWISALDKVSNISGVVISTEDDDLGERLEEIVEVILKEVRRELDVGEYPVGLRQAAEDFERVVLNQSEIIGVKVVGIVGLGGSGKSTLVTHLFNSKRSQFQRCCFLSEVSKRDLPSLQESLLRDLLCYQKSHFQDTLTGRSVLRDRLQRLTSVLIVFDDIENTDQIKNLLFVKDVVGNGSLILVTSRDKSLLVSSNVEIYNVKLLDSENAQELFCWHAFGHSEPVGGLQDMIEGLVGMCSGFPLALKVLAGKLHNERDPRKWKKELKSLGEQMPNNLLDQIVKNSYESLDLREREAFLDIAHFLIGEDADLVERILDGFNGSGSQCLQMLRQKCLVEFESTDIILPRTIHGEFVSRSIGVWGRAKGSYKIRMHDLVRRLAIQIGRKESSLRLCWRNDTMIPPRVSHVLGDMFDVRGIRRDDAVVQEDPFSKRPNDEDQLPLFLQSENICGLKFLAFQNSTLLQQFNSVRGDLIWFRFRQSNDASTPSPLSSRSLRNLIPSTLLIKNLRVLELHGVNPKDFCNPFDGHEPPSQLHELTVTCTRDYEMHSSWPADPVTPDVSKLGLSSNTSDSLRPPIDLGMCCRVWLGKLNFKNLVKLVLQNVEGLRTLRLQFEETRNLRHVDLSGCSDLEVLPDTFTDKLSKLQYLALRDCRKLVLGSLGRISTLEYLDFEGCSMLNKLPRGTEDQKSLKYLNVLRTELTELPEDLDQLKNLEELHIGSRKLTALPPSLCNLFSLTDLTLLGCTDLHFIDNSIENLVHLEKFRIYNCGVEALPERVAWMNMKILDVQKCPLGSNNLVIGNMAAGSSQAQESIDHNRSSCLTDLIIRDSRILKIDIPRAESLFPKLEIVDLSCNIYLRTLVCVSKFAGLKVLDISGCVELEILNVEGLSSTEVIKADKCWKIQRIQGLEQLQKLSYFQISVDSLPRSNCTDIMTCAPNISTAVLSGSTTKLEDVDEMDTIARRFEGVKVWRSFRDTKLQLNEKLKGAIFLYLVTDNNCKIEVTSFGHVYTAHSSGFSYPAHILMWTQDSQVFKNFKSSSDEARDFNWSKTPVKKGWIVEAENSQVCKQFIRYLFFEGYI